MPIYHLPICQVLLKHFTNYLDLISSCDLIIQSAYIRIGKSFFWLGKSYEKI